VKKNRPSFRAHLLSGAALAAAISCAQPALAESRQIDIAPQSLASALYELGSATGQQIIFTPALADAKLTRGASNAESVELALNQLLAGTGLTYQRTADAFMIVRADGPQSGSAAGGGAEVEALIVTAQKREEDIQDVPIAMSAFSQETLERTQIAGGPDLMTQVPNMTFTKTNFSGYSIQIRGIGTQAISATTDPAVAVAFNNTPFIRNRFFEQEFYDLQRVEVLRGPQGTLYGRNATAGVVNLLTARPKPVFEAKVSGDVANYNTTRLEGMINIPLVEDKVALRLAGAWTKREGYATNQMTGEQIDGRDLWSARATLGFEPNDAISAYLTYEHFEEDDDRIRSGKQLCKKDPHPLEIGGVPISQDPTFYYSYIRLYVTQGCEATSLYSDEAFQTPNAGALPYWGALTFNALPIDVYLDPYLHSTQSKNLRVIESSIEPHYRAKADLAHLQLNIDLSNDLTLTSETASSSDFSFGTQDYNRFTTVPHAFKYINDDPSWYRADLLTENLEFCDPQLGCSDRLLLADLATTESRQYSQEFRISSDYDGPLNFSGGLNFLRHDALDKYYVFVNTLSLYAAMHGGTPTGPYQPGISDNTDCLVNMIPGNPDEVQEILSCTYIDPNPMGSLNDQGHNYFLSKNPYRLISYAAFGEIYYNITPDLKLTGGLRWTVDKKHAPEIPSWLLASNTYGYPVRSVVDQEWREPTGRVAIDWKPQLTFTDETLLYASYAHGYKAGGANPPRPVIVTYANIGVTEEVQESIYAHPKTFAPEFVDAFELGTKNTLFDGRVTANGSVFYYDYKGYQISEIVDRAAVNRNFDTEVWGAELELDWRPLENLKISFKGGYEHTRVADGMKAIDLMDRTAGDPDYMVLKPFPTVPSNCIVPVSWVTDVLLGNTNNAYQSACLSYLGANGGAEAAGLGDVPNNGEGIFKDLGGNELPNAPDFTTTLTVDYTVPLPRDWLVTLHADYYRQSEAWWRIINADPYDRLKPYQTVNFAAIFSNQDAGWQVMAYVKNVFDKTSITGAFLNSDDTGLTTNVFLNEPRLFGLRVTKNWNSEPFWGTGREHTPGEPYPFTIEAGAGVTRIDAPNEVFTPPFLVGAVRELQAPLAVQDDDLDWGDSREVTITYQPKGPWLISAGYRRGETNGKGAGLATQQMSGGRFLSDDIIAQYPFIEPYDKYIPGAINFSSIDHTDQEQFSLIDFAIGKDVGLGLLDRSKLSLGLRYGEFKSASRSTFIGTTDHEDLPEENVAGFPPPFDPKYLAPPIHRYTTKVASEREFTGAGPAITWDAAKNILGNDDTGHVAIDAGIGASVLFGKQVTDAKFATEDFLGRYSRLHLPYSDLFAPISLTDGPSGGHAEKNSATVYGVSANVGLSYEVGRMKVSGGYHIEKFYDVLDGGVERRKDVDRTIDGPYIKIAVGFGG